MTEEVNIRKYSIDKVGALMMSPVGPVGRLIDDSKMNTDMSVSTNSAFASARDFRLYNDDSDVCLVSDIRNISILFEGMVLLKNKDDKQATDDFNYVIDLLTEADKAYEESGNAEEARTILYYNLVRDVYESKMKAEDLKKIIQTKHEAKQTAKDTVKDKWFKIGEYYSLKKFDLSGSLKDVHVFKCVKYIYSVSNNPVNCVVMQKIGEPLSGNARTLSRMDCRMWHIKYSPDLYMFSMTRRFYKATQKEIDEAIDRQAVIESQKHSQKVLNAMDNDFRRELGLTEEKKKFSPEDVHEVGLMLGLAEENKKFRPEDVHKVGLMEVYE